MENNVNLLNNDLQVDTEVQRHLFDTAKWAKFLSIVGFIFSTILIFSAAITAANYNETSSRGYYSSRSQTLGTDYSILFTVVTAIVWLVASIYTYRFATKMKTSLQSTDQISFNDSLKNLAKNYKFLGIATIIFLVLMVLGIFALIFFSSFSRA